MWIVASRIEIFRALENMCALIMILHSVTAAVQEENKGLHFLNYDFGHLHPNHNLHFEERLSCGKNEGKRETRGKTVTTTGIPLRPIFMDLCWICEYIKQCDLIRFTQ